jgi:molybdopterin-guanine dinucleotide biosynthesis protein A
MATSSFAAAILAGGTARRMGAPKQHHPLPDGTPMGERMLALARAVADPVVIAGPVDCMPDCVCIPDNDDFKGDGPLAGIEAALASNLAERWLVLPCDMPFLTVTLLNAMRDCTAPSVVLQGAGPLPMVLSSDALPAVREALRQGRRALRDLDCVRTAHAIPVADLTHVRDIDSPDDI